jgi:hypothetical protein
MRCRSYACAYQFLFVLVWLVGVGVPGEARAATLTVCASGCAFSDLQQALDTAQPGDTIALRAGETFVGHFILPTKPGDGPFITIRSDAPADALPPAGVRLVPHGYGGGNTDLAALARLRGTGGQWKTTPVLQAAPGAHHYRLQFLDIDGIAQQGWDSLVQLGTSSWEQTTTASMPYGIVLDRVFVHGHRTKGQKRCIELNGRDLEVLNSYVINCASVDFDAQAIGAFNGPGPYRLVNNHLEGTGENVMFGGADPKIDGVVPSDIEIRGNHFIKPLAWLEPILAAPSSPVGTVVAGGGALPAGTHYFTVVALVEAASEIALSAQSPEIVVSSDSHSAAVALGWQPVAGADRYRVYRGSSSGGQNRYIETAGAAASLTYRGSDEIWSGPPTQGTRWNIKNLLELKNAQRVVIDGNVFEQLWPASQQGYAILFTPRNEEGGAPWSVVRDVVFSNNILRHVSGGINILGEDDVRSSERTGRITIRNNLVYDMSSRWGGASHFLLVTRSPYEVKVDHNTIWHDGMVVLADDGSSSGFEFTNNAAPHNTYGIFGSGAGTGTAALETYFPGAVVRRNALGGGPAAMYPADNLFPDMATFVSQFVDAPGHDYRLVSGSALRGAGTDGRDIGVDFAALNAAAAGAVTGSGTGSAGGGNSGGGDSGGGGGDSGGEASTPYLAAPVTLPGTIEAENFDHGGQGVAYGDTTSGNFGGQYRNTDVDIEIAADVSGHYNVGWLAPGEWLNYTVNVAAAGTYDIEVRVAAIAAGGTFHIEVNGADITGPMSIPDTGGWQSWTTVTRTNVPLSAGQQVWTLVIDRAGAGGVVGNINYIRVTAGSGSTGGAATSSPFHGTPVALPGTVQAEDFDHGGQGVAYADGSPGNEGGAYRATDVDVEATTDAGGGWNVGWIGAGEWLRYTVAVASAGTYDIEVRVASASAGGTFHIEVNGADRTGPLAIPDTGGWQNWTTVRRSGVSLSAGVQVWRLVMNSNGGSGAVGNINYLQVVSTGNAPAPPDGGGGAGGRDIVLYAADVTAVAGNWARVGSWSGAAGEKMQSADWGWASTSQPLAAPADYFEARFVPEANRSYRVWLRLRAGSDSKYNDSVWVQFASAVDAGGGALWRIGTDAGLLVNLESCGDCGVADWGWHNGAWWLNEEAVVRFPTTAPQTIRVQTREDGVEVDQIVLSPATYFNAAPGRATNDTTIVPKP